MKEAALVLLWWNDELRLMGPAGELVRGGRKDAESPAPFVIRTAAERFADCGRLRIIYQPDGLQVHTVPNPGSGRQRALRSLTQDFRALENCDTVWCLDAPGRDSAEATLSLELRSGLQPAADALARSGFRVEGAWTLATLLEGVPCPGPTEAGFLRMAIVGGRMLLVSADAAGRRRIRASGGSDWENSAASDLRTELARFEDSTRVPALVAFENGEGSPELNRILGGANPTEITIPALLAQARRLPKGGALDLLAPASRARGLAQIGRRLALGLLLALAVSIPLAIFRHRAAAGRRQAAWERSLRDQRLALSQAENAQAEREQLRQRWNSIMGPKPGHDALLAALAQAAPPDLVIREVTCHGDRFHIAGRILDGGSPPAETLGAFRQVLLAHDPPWRIDATPVDRDGGFSWSGSFLEGIAAFPASISEARAALGEAMRRLRSAEDEDRWLAGLERRWRVVARSAAREGDLGLGRYVLAFDRAPIDAWPDVMGLVQSLCVAPGVRIDELALVAAPDAESFSQAEVRFTVAFRP